MNAWYTFFNKKAPNMVLRIVALLFSQAVVAFGIAISRNTDLGLSAISTIPGVLDYATPLSLGTITFIFNVLLVLAQVVLLRREFNPFQFLAIPFVFVFSWFIDLFVPVAALLPMPNYVVRLLFSLLSCAFIALGVWLQTKVALLMLPGDGIVQTISYVFHTNFGKTKMVFDSSLIATGALISLLTMGGLYGVREGSVIAAVLVGAIIRFFDPKLAPFVAKLIPVEGHVSLIPRR